jgi:hypothetical protein
MKTNEVDEPNPANDLKKHNDGTSIYQPPSAHFF